MDAAPASDRFDLVSAGRYAVSLLEGELVRLRGLRPEDLPILDGWWNDPHIAILNTARVDAGVAGGTESMFRSWSANDSMAAAGFCIERRSDRALAGHVALWGANPKDRDAKIGILIGPQFQDAGLGSDAMRLAIRYGFEEMGLHRITLGVYAFNTRAVAVYTKLGFVAEGRAREAIWHAGRWHDELSMGLLADEWRATRD